MPETIFNVGMAKFASEKSQDLDVGQRTAMFVSRKSNQPNAHRADPLMESETFALRKIWQEHVRPRMPMEGRDLVNRISHRISGEIEASDVTASIQAHIRHNLPEQAD